MSDLSFISTQGKRISFRIWAAEKQPRGVVVISHGYREHGGRYEEFAVYLNRLGYHVFAHDHMGHGRSEGLQAHVRRFTTFVDDLGIFIDIVLARCEGLPLFLFGQSMGAVIALLYAVGKGEKIAGLILSAPALIVALSYSPFVRSVGKVLAALIPRVKADKGFAEDLSRDARVVEDYKNDPLVYNGRNRIGFGYILLNIETWVTPELPKLKVPLLTMHGTEDRVADPKSSRIIYENAESSDKTLKWFSALYHELLHEPEKKEVMKLISEWLEKHI